MNGTDKNRFDYTNALIAGLVFVITLIIYLRTVSPTVSFWDCGEFVACSYILGIAHPPGFPLYLLIGRIFSILPLAADIAFRVNLLSAISSTVMATFAYLVIVRLIRQWYNDRTDRLHRIIAYIGGFAGSLFAAFSTTNWANSVEAEVYALTMAVMLIIYWLTLRYNDFKETPVGTRSMILAFYLGMLAIGIHMTAFLIVPVIALYIILKKEAGPREWGLFAIFFTAELYLIFDLSSRPGEVPYYVPIIIMALIYIFHLALKARYNLINLVTLGLFILAAWPFYFVLINASQGGESMASGLDSAMNLPIGWIGLGALTLWGLYAAFRRYNSGENDDNRGDWQMAAVYSLIPLLLHVVGEIFHGYNSFLFLSVVLTALLAFAVWRFINILILIAVGSFSMIVLGFYPFIYGVVFGLVAILILSRFLKKENWKAAVAIVLLGVIGFSVHLFIPIRSAHNPAIDENNPSESLSAMVGYLERKQYGAESMTERMFTRRGEWSHQFGDFKRMGFWRFFKQQYGFDGPWFVIVLILGAFGIWETIRRKPQLGLPLMVLIFICTVGLTLYMNFADGTRINPVSGRDYLEVRNRDYFWTPGFVFFGMAIGLGIAAFVDMIRDTFAKSAKGLKFAVTGLAGLLVLLPIVPLKNNYFENDRSKNYMAYDYAYNFLISCAPDAILICNGDNDTFPVWCLQQVYDIRSDVKTVNLSLGNLTWYIKQVRDNGVPISWNDDEILRLRPYRNAQGQEFRIQDQLVNEILTRNRWKYPIQFTVTTPNSNRQYFGKSLDEYLLLDGMLFTLDQSQGKNRVNVEKTEKLLWEEYNFRGINDPDVYKDEAALRLTGNYAQAIMWLADTLRLQEKYDEAQSVLKRGIEILPQSYDLYGYNAQMHYDMGVTDSIPKILADVPTWKQREVFMSLGSMAAKDQNWDDAKRFFRKSYEIDNENTEAYQALSSVFYHLKEMDSLRAVISEWVTSHPNDTTARRLYNDLQRMPDIPKTVPSDSGNNE